MTKKMKTRSAVYYNREHPWSTSMELDFISRLGTHRKGVKTSRFELLQNYIASAKFRNWGALDGRRCLRFARNELRREVKKLADQEGD